MKKVFRIVLRILLVVLIIAVAGIGYMAWQTFPIISGYGAKDLCSCVFVGKMNGDYLVKKQLSDFPLSLGSFSIDTTTMSATGRVFGVAARTAVYREGFGCTLASELDEKELRDQNFQSGFSIADSSALRPWPQGEVLADSIDPRYEYVKHLVADAFVDTSANQARNLRALIVIHKNRIVAEQYGEGYSVSSKLPGWSMSKSIMNALVGVMQKEGLLNVNDAVALKEWNDDERKQIKISNLMQANSGLEWEESYGGPSPVTNMLYKAADMGHFASGFALEKKPGEVFKYSSGSANIVSYLLRKKLGDREYHQFPYTKLFHRIGMYQTVLEPDASGTYVASSYTLGTARDWARFGMLYCNNGNWFGDQILTPEWIEFTTTPASGTEYGEYGALFWLNKGNPNDSSQRYYPDIPRDLYCAEGFLGQRLYVLPSKELVVLKLGHTFGNHLNDNLFLSAVLAKLP